jgi:hypothetical protein
LTAPVPSFMYNCAFYIISLALILRTSPFWQGAGGENGKIGLHLKSSFILTHCANQTVSNCFASRACLGSESVGSGSSEPRSTLCAKFRQTSRKLEGSRSGMSASSTYQSTRFFFFFWGTFDCELLVFILLGFLSGMRELMNHFP